MEKSYDNSSLQKKQYQCDICDARFTQNIALKTHMTNSAWRMKPFQCDIYDATFTKKKFDEIKIVIIKTARVMNSVNRTLKLSCSICIDYIILIFKEYFHYFLHH